jgi:hypothetical protein
MNISAADSRRHDPLFSERWKLEIGNLKPILPTLYIIMEKDSWTLVHQWNAGTELAKSVSNFQLPASIFLKTEGDVFSNPLYKHAACLHTYPTQIRHPSFHPFIQTCTQKSWRGISTSQENSVLKQSLLSMEEQLEEAERKTDLTIKIVERVQQVQIRKRALQNDEMVEKKPNICMHGLPFGSFYAALENVNSSALCVCAAHAHTPTHLRTLSHAHSLRTNC